LTFLPVYDITAGYVLYGSSVRDGFPAIIVAHTLFGSKTIGIVLFIAGIGQ